MCVNFTQSTKYGPIVKCHNPISMYDISIAWSFMYASISMKRKTLSLVMQFLYT